MMITLQHPVTNQKDTKCHGNCSDKIGVKNSGFRNSQSCRLSIVIEMRRTVEKQKVLTKIATKLRKQIAAPKTRVNISVILVCTKIGINSDCPNTIWQLSLSKC
jgi:hypothetical protein